MLGKLLAFLGIFGTATFLYADADSPITTGAPVPSATSTTSATMSVAEMQARASELISRAQDAYQDVLRLKEQAKKQKDVIKLNCVNEKLIQIKGQLNVADNQNQDLQVAITRNSPDRSTAYDALQVTGTAIFRLRDDAKTCIGEPELYKQESGVTVTHPPIVDDPTAPPDYGWTVEPPGYASPYR
ncbi:MAG TPA: hypothetical protein VLT45_16135 [Kofleriaceae bacterium]|nr:hypothetical protein [Kofleriaceae bacterium]